MTNTVVVDPKLVVAQFLEKGKKAAIAKQEREAQKREALLQSNVRKLLAKYGIPASVANQIIKAEVTIEKSNHPKGSRFFTFDDWLVEGVLKAWAQKSKRRDYPSELKWSHFTDDHNPADLSHKYYNFNCQMCILVMLLKQWMETEGDMVSLSRSSYDEWLEGYIRKGGKPTHPFPELEMSRIGTGDGQLLLAQSNFTLIPLPEKMAILVPKEFQPQSLENIGPNTTLLLMDGFRVKGKRWVPAFANSLQPKEIQADPEETEARPETKVSKSWFPFGRRKK